MYFISTGNVSLYISFLQGTSFWKWKNFYNNQRKKYFFSLGSLLVNKIIRLKFNKACKPLLPSVVHGKHESIRHRKCFRPYQRLFIHYVLYIVAHHVCPYAFLLREYITFHQVWSQWSDNLCCWKSRINTKF